MPTAVQVRRYERGYWSLVGLGGFDDNGNTVGHFFKTRVQPFDIIIADGSFPQLAMRWLEAAGMIDIDFQAARRRMQTIGSAMVGFIHQMFWEHYLAPRRLDAFKPGILLTKLSNLT